MSLSVVLLPLVLIIWVICFFNSGQGIYLVSVTKSGCLTVHDFESLYCRTSGSAACKTADFILL